MALVLVSVGMLLGWAVVDVVGVLPPPSCGLSYNFLQDIIGLCYYSVLCSEKELSRVIVQLNSLVFRLWIFCFCLSLISVVRSCVGNVIPFFCLVVVSSVAPV